MSLVAISSVNTSKNVSKHSLKTFIHSLQISSNFIKLIFNITATSIQCESYNKRYYENQDSDYISIEGIADPQTCVYKQPINDLRTMLSVTSAVAKENIVLLDIDHTQNSKYLPVYAGREFPNLSKYNAENRGVIRISKDNFFGMKKIRFIDLDNNRITSLTQDVFAGLTALERIDLGEFFEKPS